MSILLSYQGIILKNIQKERKERLKKRFTVVEKKGFGKYAQTLEHPYYIENKNCIAIPRYGLNLSSANIKNIIQTRPINVRLKDVVFKENQLVAINTIKTRFNNALKKDKKPLKTGGVVILDTGQGKTYVALGLINAFKQKCLYVVHNEKALLDKVEVFEEKTNCKVGKYYGKEKSDGDIVVILINSMTTLNTKYFSQFGMVIYDELHKYITPKRLKIFTQCNLVYTIGLTATPDKKKDFVKAMQDLVGPFIEVDKLKGYLKNQFEFKGRVRVLKYHGITKPQKGSYYISSIKTINEFPKDKTRTRIILNEIERTLEKSNNIYIFSETNTYLEHIYFKCKIFNVKMSILKGGSTEEDFEDALSSRIIFTNYAYGTEALSISHMDALFYITPRKAGTQQSTGRILRLDGDLDKERLIIDLVDTNLPMSKQLRERIKIYELRGFPVKQVIYKNFNKYRKENRHLYSKKKQNIMKLIEPCYMSEFLFETWF